MAKNSLIDSDFIEEDEVDIDDEKEFNLPSPKDRGDDDDIEVDIVDDTPDEDKGKWVASDDDEIGEAHDDEIKSYSKKVQKRIADATARAHAERRAKEQIQRDNDELLKIAKRILNENNALKETIETGEKVLVGEHRGRLEGQLAQAKAMLREATEAGDTDGIVAAQEKMSLVAAQMQSIANRRSAPLQRVSPDDFEKSWREQRQPAPATQPDQPDPRAVEWLKRNQRWWRRDDAMTAYALGLHKQIVEREGIQPDEDEYWNRLDVELSKRFPERYEGAPRRQSRRETIVAPAVRSGKGPTRRVTLTESEVRVARRLGLTPEQYAEQVLLERKKGNGREFTHTPRR